jgi:hypothetical protein
MAGSTAARGLPFDLRDRTAGFGDRAVAGLSRLLKNPAT